MNPILISIVVIVCTYCGTHLGLRIRKSLPEDHLSADTKEIVKLSAGLIATLTALVLGLLVSSAKDTLDTMNRELTQDGAKIILLDRNPGQLWAGNERDSHPVARSCRLYSQTALERRYSG